MQEKHALAVTTRAQKKNQERLEEDKHQQERACEVQSHALNRLDTSTSQEDTSDWVEMEEMDDDLFGHSSMKTRKTRAENRRERHRRGRLQAKQVSQGNTPIDGEEQGNDIPINGEDQSKHELDISSEELKVLQCTDPSQNSSEGAHV